MKFVCPRCDEEVVEQFYGPCDTCRIVLREWQVCTQNGKIMR